MQRYNQLTTYNKANRSNKHCLVMTKIWNGYSTRKIGERKEKIMSRSFISTKQYKTVYDCFSVHYSVDALYYVHTRKVYVFVVKYKRIYFIRRVRAFARVSIFFHKNKKSRYKKGEKGCNKSERFQNVLFFL